jgi:hypothetical protein
MSKRFEVLGRSVCERLKASLVTRISNHGDAGFLETFGEFLQTAVIRDKIFGAEALGSNGDDAIVKTDAGGFGVQLECSLAGCVIRFTSRGGCEDFDKTLWEVLSARIPRFFWGPQLPGDF